MARSDTLLRPLGVHALPRPRSPLGCPTLGFGRPMNKIEQYAHNQRTQYDMTSQGLDEARRQVAPDYRLIRAVAPRYARLALRSYFSHLNQGYDPDRTDVKLVDILDNPDGRHGTLVITPRDPYGNPLGPGRPGVFTVAPLPGVKGPGKIKDRGDGSYGIDIVWDPTKTPGVWVQQPDRDPVPVTPPSADLQPCEGTDCTKAASELLDCLGLCDTDVERVRIKKVSLEIDMKDPDCNEKDEPDKK